MPRLAGLRSARPAPGRTAARWSAPLGAILAGLGAVLALTSPAGATRTSTPSGGAVVLTEPIQVGGRLVFPEGAAIPRSLTLPELDVEIERPTPQAIRTAAAPRGTLHCTAEYEPTEAILVAWEGASDWRDILARIGAAVTVSGNADFHVLVEGSTEEAEALSRLRLAGADEARVRFFRLPTDTIWMRDYGPRYAYEEGVRVIIDHTYNRPRPVDNGLPELYGEARGHARYELPLVHGGGNFHLSALGSAWATRLIANENPSLTEADIQALWADYQGLDTTIVDAFPQAVDATQHLDMWVLPVADDRVLVSDWPSNVGSVQDRICDAAALDFATRGFTVFRTPARSVNGTHYTYTNAVLCNGLAIIPSYSNPSVAPHDAEALAVYRAALPSHAIVQLDAQDIVTASGVFHCIVMHVPSAAGGSRPTAYLQTLRGCEVVAPGTDVEVRWISDDDVRTIEADVLLSLDGGVTFPTILARGLPDTGSFTWTVPPLETAQARLRLVVRDADGNEAVDESDFDLLIRSSREAPPPPRDPLLVAKAGSDVAVSIGAATGARAYNAYEGTIGVWYSPARAACHLDEQHPGFRSTPPDVTLTLAPLAGNRWFLVSSADCLGESPLFATPHAWLCGATD